MGALAQVPRAFSPVAAEHAQWPRLRLTDASHGLSRPAVESGGVVGARKLLASDEYLGATAEEPGSMHPSERSCWTRRVVRQGRTLVRSRGWQVGSAGSSKRNLQRCMPRRGRSNDAQTRFQRRVQRRAGRAPQPGDRTAQRGPNAARRERDRSRPGNRHDRRSPRRHRVPALEAARWRQTPLARARAGTVARWVRCRAHRGSPSRLRASSSDSPRATCPVDPRVQTRRPSPRPPSCDAS